MSTVETTSDPVNSRSWTTTDVWIVIYWTYLFVTVLIFILQIISMAYNAARLNAQRSPRRGGQQDGQAGSLLVWGLFGTYISCIAGISATIARLNAWPHCSSCSSAYVLVFVFYICAKTANYFFFLQRARVAQGIEQLLPKICFVKVIPGILALLLTIDIILISTWPVEGTCKTSPRTGRTLCVWDADRIKLYHMAAFGLQIFVDVCATIFFLWLFGKPLYTIIKNRETISKKSKQNSSDRKVRRTMQINFILSVCTMLSTSLFAVTWWWVGVMAWLAITDYMWNSICLFLMLASNRRLLMHMCCPFKKSTFATWLYDNYGRKEVETRNAYDPQQVIKELEAKAKENADKKQPDPSHSRNSITSTFSPHSKMRSISINPYENNTTPTPAISPVDESCIYYKSRLFWTWCRYSCCCPTCYCCTCPKDVLLKCCPLQCNTKNQKRREERDYKYKRLFKSSNVNKMWQLKRRARGNSSISSSPGLTGTSTALHDRTLTRKDSSGGTSFSVTSGQVGGVILQVLPPAKEEEHNSNAAEEDQLIKSNVDTRGTPSASAASSHTHTHTHTPQTTIINTDIVDRMPDMAVSGNDGNISQLGGAVDGGASEDTPLQLKDDQSSQSEHTRTVATNLDEEEEPETLLEVEEDEYQEQNQNQVLEHDASNGEGTHLV